MQTVLSRNPQRNPAKRDPSKRDPAWMGRLFWLLAGAALLWPALVLTEFRVWTLFEASNLKPTLKFLGDFFPPKIEGEFLLLVAKETWRTVAIATAGIALAMVLAVPLALLSVRVLSVSALTGKMNTLPAVLRTLLRWVMVLLRSVPELIWALIFVRVVGLGPTAGVIAIALTYGGMLGKVYAEILESGDAQVTQSLLRNGSGRLQAFFLRPAAPKRCRVDQLFGVPLGVRHPLVSRAGFCGRRWLGSANGRIDEDVQWL